MFLEIMQQLSVVMLDADVTLFDCLLKGVSAGFQNDIPPSNCFGRNDKPALPETPLSVHLANWQSAEIDMEVTRNLVQEEINQGWVYEFEGGIEAAKDFFPAVAIGRLGVAYSNSRPPRLVVHSSVCGGAFWWQRVGGWILRFFRLFIRLSHSAFLYVEDYFWSQRKDIIHLTSTTLAMLCRCLGIPISWKKCELSHTVQWIGWTFHISAGYISLPQDKRSKLVKYIKSLIAHNRIPRNQFEKTIGLAMWVTQLFPFMRIWLQYLYADLHNHPATNYSMDPGPWPKIAEHLSPELIFVSQPAGTRIPVGGRLISARHQELTSLDDLSKVRITDKRLWMRIKDPTSDKRILSVSSKRILNILLTWLNHVSPYVLLRPKPLWKGLAAADMRKELRVELEVSLRKMNPPSVGFPNGTACRIFVTLKSLCKMTGKNLFQDWKH